MKSCKSFTCPRGKSLLVECHPLDDQIVRGLLLPTLGYLGVPDSGAQFIQRDETKLVVYTDLAKCQSACQVAIVANSSFKVYTLLVSEFVNRGKDLFELLNPCQLSTTQIVVKSSRIFQFTCPRFFVLRIIFVETESFAKSS